MRTICEYRCLVQLCNSAKNARSYIGVTSWTYIAARPTSNFSFSVRHLFIARQHTRTRDIDIANLSVCPSVRPSVRDVPVLDENGLTYRHSFSPYGEKRRLHAGKLKNRNNLLMKLAGSTWGASANTALWRFAIQQQSTALQSGHTSQVDVQ